MDYCCVRPLHESDLPALRELLLADGEKRLKQVLGFVPNADELRRQTFADTDYVPELMTGVFSDRLLVGCAVGVTRAWKPGREHTGFVKWLVVHPDHRRTGMGGMLLDALHSSFAARGMQSLEFGSAAPWYLLPGVPADDTALRSLLESRGWEFGPKRTNLYVDPRQFTNGVVPVIKNFEITEVSANERFEFLNFIEQNFSVSWAIECEDAFRQNGFMLKCTDKSGVPVGFAAVGATNRNWFGPMGVMASTRGQGAGKALLLAALRLAHQQGISRICIPWAAEGFYTRCLGDLERFEFLKAGFDYLSV